LSGQIDYLLNAIDYDTDSLLTGRIREQVARERVAKGGSRKQSAEFGTEILTQVCRFQRDFSNQFETSIDDGDYVFEVVTDGVVVPASAVKGL